MYTCLSLLVKAKISKQRQENKVTIHASIIFPQPFLLVSLKNASIFIGVILVQIWGGGFRVGEEGNDVILL